MDLHCQHGVAITLGEGDAAGGVEDCGDLGVNVDELVGLDSNFLVSCVDLGQDPLLEITISEDAEDIDDPLLWESGTLLEVVRDISPESWAPVDVGVDLLETESIVLGDEAVADLVLLEKLFLPADDIFEEI